MLPKLNNLSTGALEDSVVLYFKNRDMIIMQAIQLFCSTQVISSFYLYWICGGITFIIWWKIIEMIFSLACFTLLCSTLHCIINIFYHKLIFFSKQAHLINEHLLVTVFLSLCLDPLQKVMAARMASFESKMVMKQCLMAPSIETAKPVVIMERSALMPLIF